MGILQRSPIARQSGSPQTPARKRLLGQVGRFRKLVPPQLLTSPLHHQSDVRKSKKFLASGVPRLAKLLILMFQSPLCLSRPKKVMTQNVRSPITQKMRNNLKKNDP